MHTGGILIVDDNDLNREICQLNLQALGVPLHFAIDGQDGLKKAIDIKPDLILLDIMMPVMDGFAMLAQIQQSSVLKNIPVLMLTARSDTESTIRALEAGANDYLKKPFEEEELVARVQTLLRNSMLEKKVREDLQAGAVMQQKFFADLPNTRTTLDSLGLECAIYNKPYATISGDFHLLSPTAETSLGFFLGDSCGHGLPAALISMRIFGVLDHTRQQGLRPSHTLSVLNDDIGELLPTGKFIAASCVTFEPEKITISNGAQPYPILLKNGLVKELKIKGYPLGLVPSRRFEEKNYPFLPGDVLILYTDGICEAVNSEDQLFGKDRIVQILNRCASQADAQTILDTIIARLSAFTEATPIEDDRTMVIFKKK